jgi:hypothetical protein
MIVDRRLALARIAVVAIGFAVVGGAAGGIFDRVELMLVVAPLIVAAVAGLVVTRHPAIRLGGAVGSIILAVALTVAVAGGTPQDVVSSFSSGIQGLLSTEWPSPTQPDLLGAVALIVATGCAISAEMAARQRFHLAALLPLVISYLVVVGLSSPLGVRWLWLILLAAVMIVFALLRSDGTLADRLLLLRGEHRLIPLLLVAAGLATVAAVPLSLEVRADPRRNDPPEQTAPLLDPIEATLAIRDLEPAADLHVIVTGDDVPVPTRWRTAALSSYNGQRWTPDLTLRPIGFTLGPATGSTIDASVSFLDDNLTLVPLPGPPVSVDAAVETDLERTVVRLADRPDPGDTIDIEANLSPTSATIAEIGVAPRVVDDATSGFTQLAEGLAGDGTDLERLRRLETTLRDDFVLDNEVQGGGLAQALIERFLRDTQRGTSEQFATSFVLLVRSLGIEARVATGFIADGDAANAPPDALVGGPLVLRSSDATVWPEVQLADGRWLAFDPVPAEETSDAAPPPPEPQVQSPAAPQPPIAPPPESDNETTTPEDETATETSSALSTALTWVARGVAVFTFALLPFIVAAGLILGIKYRRRRRRLRAAEPADRIRGAWASATDALVDAGLRIARSNTDPEIADHGAPMTIGAERDLRRLATLSSAATYGTPRHLDLLAQDASSCLGSVESALGSSRTRWQRARWRLSLRSLRRSTRSPVTS